MIAFRSQQSIRNTPRNDVVLNSIRCHKREICTYQYDWNITFRLTDAFDLRECSARALQGIYTCSLWPLNAHVICRSRINLLTFFFRLYLSLSSFPSCPPYIPIHWGRGNHGWCVWFIFFGAYTFVHIYFIGNQISCKLLNNYLPDL